MYNGLCIFFLPSCITAAKGYKWKTKDTIIVGSTFNKNTVLHLSHGSGRNGLLKD